MKISEKQIHILLASVKAYRDTLELLDNKMCKETSLELTNVLREIYDQQSDELREVE